MALQPVTCTLVGGGGSIWTPHWVGQASHLQNNCSIYPELGWIKWSYSGCGNSNQPQTPRLHGRWCRATNVDTFNLFQRTNLLTELEPWHGGEKELRRRAKYLKSCKDALWNRWSREYLIALRERHNLDHRRAKLEVQEEDNVLVKSGENRGKWPLGKTPISIALSCDKSQNPGRDELNPRAVSFRPRQAAAKNIKLIASRSETDKQQQ